MFLSVIILVSIAKYVYNKQIRMQQIYVTFIYSWTKFKELRKM